MLIIVVNLLIPVQLATLKEEMVSSNDSGIREGMLKKESSPGLSSSLYIQQQHCWSALAMRGCMASLGMKALAKTKKEITHRDSKPPKIARFRRHRRATNNWLSWPNKTAAAVGAAIDNCRNQKIR